MIKRTGRGLAILLLLIMGGIVLYLVAALIFSLLPTHPARQICPVEKEIFIASNGVHLDIIIPVKDIDPQILQNLIILPGTTHLAFGWGDKEFYIKTPEWSDLTFPVAFKTLFLKSETAMHITCLTGPLHYWKKVKLCNSQLFVLNRHIQDSFKKDDQGNFLKMEFEGYNRYDMFYDATGSFSLFQTCNVWVNVALKKMEVKTSIWSPFVFGVLHHIKE